jgi:hypothetical protein
VTPHIVSTANNFGYGTITVSAYIKAAGRNSARILLSGSSGMTFPGGSGVAFGTINLTTGATSSLSTGLTAVATNAGNGWWRLAITVTNSFGGNMAIRIDVGDGSSYNPTGSEAILVWGVQCETASSASEYDPYPLGGETDTNNNFVSGDYVESGASGGLLGNGSSKYLNTGLTLDGMGFFSTGHVSAYHSTPTGSNSNRYFIGCFGPSNLNRVTLGSDIFATSEVTGHYGGGPLARQTGYGTQTGAPAGHRVISRETPTSLTHYLNGSSVASNTGGSSPSSNAVSMFVHALNVNGTASYFNNSRIMAYSIGAALSSAQNSSYYTAMQAFQTALARNL